MKLTDSKIKSIKPKDKRFIAWETGTGLGVRVTPNSRKSFIFMYRFGGKARMMTIGPYPRISLVEARLKVAKAKEQLHNEIDPGEKYLETRRAKKEALTVADLAFEFLEKWSKVKKKSWAEDERIIQKDIVPVLGEKKAEDVKRRDIVLLLDKIMERNAPIMANRTFNIIRKMFVFAVSRGILNSTPCVAITPPGKENQRDRFLTEDEIEIFWNGLPVSGISKPCQLAMKLVLTTGQRRGEVVEAQWSEFDMDGKLWTIPAAKAKNNLQHAVPLSDLALILLEYVKALAGNSVYLFPSPQTQTHIDPRAVTRALRKSQDHFRLEQFQVHDLRRSAATGMAKMGVSRFDIGQVLNHSEKSVTKVYDRFEYLPQKRDALERWGRKLEQIFSGEPGKGKIIELKSRV